MKHEWKILTKRCNDVEEGLRNNKNEKQEIVRNAKLWWAMTTACALLIFGLGCWAFLHFFISSKIAPGEVSSATSSTTKSDDSDDAMSESPKLPKTYESLYLESRRFRPLDISRNSLALCRALKLCSSPIAKRSILPKISDESSMKFKDFEIESDESEESDESNPDHVLEKTDDYNDRVKYFRQLMDLLSPSGRNNYNNTHAMIIVPYLRTNVNVENLSESDRRDMWILHRLHDIDPFEKKKNDERNRVAKRSAIPHPETSEIPNYKILIDSIVRPNGTDKQLFNKDFLELLRRLKNKYFGDVDYKTKERLFAPLEEKSRFLMSIRGNRKSGRRDNKRGDIPAMAAYGSNNVETSDATTSRSKDDSRIPTSDDIQL